MNTNVVVIIALAFLMSCGCVNASTNVCGTYSTNMTWDLSGSPYVVTCSLTVDPGVTLTISPGVTVQFSSGTMLLIHGKLAAIGTGVNSISFTSNAPTPSPGNWRSIYFSSTADVVNSRLSYVNVSYGGATDPASIVMRGPYSPTFATIDHLNVSYSSSGGIYLGSSNYVTVDSSTVSNCTGTGITVETGGQVLNSTISNNGSYGINYINYAWGSLSNNTITNNGNYAIGSDANATLNSLSGLTISGNGGGTKDVVGLRGGTPNGNGVMRAGATWEVLGSITIPSGYTFTVDAGVTAKFASGVELQIFGKLTSVGTETSPITFSSNAANPIPGSWRGIVFFPGSNAASRISYSSVLYGGSGGVGAIFINNSSPSLDHLFISRSSTAGIQVDSISNPTIQYCVFTLNSSGIVNSTTSNIITAKNNYWGSVSGPSGSGPGGGQSVSSGILYEPWLTASYSLPNYFSSASVVNRVFNPTLSINTKVNFVSALSGDWSLIMVNGSGNTVRSFSGTGISATVIWDGKDDTGIPLSNGTYTYQISSSTAANEVATPIRGTVIIDTNRLLTMSNVLLTPSYFSPNSDAVQDTTKLTATASFDDATWNLDIRNSANSIVRSLTSEGNAFSYTWDGKDSNANVQADGSYSFQLSVHDGTATANTSQTTILDNSPPLALISSPSENLLLSNFYNNGSATVPIVGSASDVNFTNWNLSYGTGGIWTTLTTGTTPVSNANFANWNSMGVSNGVYSFRLQVFDTAGNRTTVIRNVTLGNFSATQNAYEIDRRTTPSVVYISVIPFTLSETITIRNKSGQAVRTIAMPSRNPGTYFDSWNFTNDAGISLPDGPYFYTATVTDSVTTMLWDTSNIPIDTSVGSCIDSLRNDAFDPFNNGAMTYVLYSCFLGPSIVTVLTSEYWPAPGCGDPLTYCLWSGEYIDHGSGNHYIRFVGVDDTNKLRPFVTSKIIRAPSSINTVLAYGTKPSITNIAATPSVHAPLRGTQNITFALGTFQNQPVTVATTYFSHASNATVRTITMNNILPGAITIPWDGRSDDGNYVSPGDYYVITVTVTDSRGNITKEKIITIVNY